MSRVDCEELGGAGSLENSPPELLAALSPEVLRMFILFISQHEARISDRSCHLMLSESNCKLPCDLPAWMQQCLWALSNRT